jgi:hypothetical protein
MRSQEMIMTAKTFIVAVALLATATSAALANVPARGGASGDWMSDYGSGQPGPDSGEKATR